MTISAVIDQVFEWMETTHILGLEVPAGREDTGLCSNQRQMVVGQSDASVGLQEGRRAMGAPQFFPNFLALSCVASGRWDNLSGPPFLISKNQSVVPAMPLPGLGPSWNTCTGFELVLACFCCPKA